MSRSKSVSFERLLKDARQSFSCEGSVIVIRVQCKDAYEAAVALDEMREASARGDGITLWGKQLADEVKKS